MNDGNIIVGTTSAKLIKIDSNGNLVWNKNIVELINSIYEFDINSISVMNDGNIIVGTTDAELIKVDSNGNLVWNKNIVKLINSISGFEINTISSN